MRPCLFFFILVKISISSLFAQDNFSYSPAQPKPGDRIVFTYEPAGDIANSLSPVEAIGYQLGDKGEKAFDIVLTRAGKKLSGSLQTDSSGNFVYFSFSANKKFDNNFNNGYTISLYNDNKPAKGAGISEAYYYQFYSENAGVERNNAKALECYEKEFTSYPENRKKYLLNYFRLYAAEKKDEAAAKIQKEIEASLKDGLKEEADYTNLENLYKIAKLPAQANFIAGLKKEKYPAGDWTIGDEINRFNNEPDAGKKEALLNTIIAKTQTDAAWTAQKQNLDYYKTRVASSYARAKKWDEMKQYLAKAGITGKDQLVSFYNNLAWDMQADSTNLPYAAEMSKYAVDYAKAEWKKPSAAKPDYLTAKQWEASRKAEYATYADTYAMILYRMGEYKKGLPYTKEAALDIAEGKNADENNTYALLAEKALPQKEYKKQLEQFVKDGKSTAAIKEILKRAYTKENKNDTGFDDYITGLEKEAYLKLIEELRKSMLNETAPAFALYNLDNKKIDLTELKGKIVVVDFWATWCGPCKASFPGMQKIVTKYKDNPDVKFVFVDTWERGDDKKKNAQEFIDKNKYSFDVLMDTDDNVVNQFKVEGIPTKFIIDKNNKIRFKSVGFDGSDDKLVQELTAMIEMAENPDKKAF